MPNDTPAAQKPTTCSQCGKPWAESACGPTHILLAMEYAMEPNTAPSLAPVGEGGEPPSFSLATALQLAFGEYGVEPGEHWAVTPQMTEKLAAILYARGVRLASSSGPCARCREVVRAAHCAMTISFDPSPDGWLHVKVDDFFGPLRELCDALNKPCTCPAPSVTKCEACDQPARYCGETHPYTPSPTVSRDAVEKLARNLDVRAATRADLNDPGLTEYDHGVGEACRDLAAELRSLFAPRAAVKGEP